MKYLLDTNAVIQILRAHPAITRRLTQQNPQDVAISAIVAHELFYGAYKSTKRNENLQRIESMRFEILEFDQEDARCAGEIRAALSQPSNPIGPYDILIAGQALSRSLTLITHNTKEFTRVTGLNYEDWEG